MKVDLIVLNSVVKNHISRLFNLIEYYFVPGIKDFTQFCKSYDCRQRLITDNIGQMADVAASPFAMVGHKLLALGFVLLARILVYEITL